MFIQVGLNKICTLYSSCDAFVNFGFEVPIYERFPGMNYEYVNATNAVCPDVWSDYNGTDATSREGCKIKCDTDPECM